MAARKPKQRRGPPSPGASQQGRPGAQGQGAPAGSWAPLRDSIRRDIEQALGALAFAATIHERLESQRRLFADFPRVTEQIRSGPFERVASALARLYEGKEQFDLSRFLRDLPLALAQLAAQEARRSAPPPPATGEGAAAAASAGGAAEAGQTTEGEAPGPQASGGVPESSPPPAQPEAAAPSGEALSQSPATPAPEVVAPAATPSQPPPPAASAEPPGPPSPRVELRTRMLAAVPQLSKAVLTYRRTVATVRRAAAPRRSPGPWRSDREVLEEAQRAIEFAQQMFDAYAEAWADQPVQPGIAASVSAEADRFLAWTQLSRYVDLAGRGATQGSPGAGGQQGEPTARAARTVEPPRQPESSKPPPEPSKPPEPAEAAEPSAPEPSATQGSPGAGGEAASEGGA
jgi:hypothetical protein